MTYEKKSVSPEKAAIVAAMQEKLTSAQGAVFVGFSGLTVADVTKLRRKFIAAGVEYKVIKNTLTRIAADNAGMHILMSSGRQGSIWMPSRGSVSASWVCLMQ